MKSSSEWVIYACGISELRPFGSVHWPKRKSLPLGRASCYTTPIDRSERVFMGGDDSKAAGAVRTEFIADDVTLVADVAGDPDAPTVVLMHGGGQTRHSWSGAMRALLDEGYRVINYDARGHGESSWSADGVYTFARRAADLRTVLAEIAAPVALVGASMGGLTAMQAIGEGALPSAVVLVDIVLRPEPRGVQRIRNFMRANPGGFADYRGGGRRGRGLQPGTTPLQGFERPGAQSTQWHRWPLILALGSAHDEREVRYRRRQCRSPGRGNKNAAECAHSTRPGTAQRCGERCGCGRPPLADTLARGLRCRRRPHGVGRQQ